MLFQFICYVTNYSKMSWLITKAVLLHLSIVWGRNSGRAQPVTLSSQGMWCRALR